LNLQGPNGMNKSMVKILKIKALVIDQVGIIFNQTKIWIDWFQTKSNQIIHKGTIYLDKKINAQLKIIPARPVVQYWAIK